MDKKLLGRINQLAKTQKERELTTQELQEQAELRNAYLKAFREQVKEQLSRIKLVDS